MHCSQAIFYLAIALVCCVAISQAKVDVVYDEDVPKNLQADQPWITPLKAGSAEAESLLEVSTNEHQIPFYYGDPSHPQAENYMELNPTPSAFDAFTNKMISGSFPGALNYRQAVYGGRRRRMPYFMTRDAFASINPYRRPNNFDLAPPDVIAPRTRMFLALNPQSTDMGKSTTGKNAKPYGGISSFEPMQQFSPLVRNQGALQFIPANLVVPPFASFFPEAYGSMLRRASSRQLAVDPFSFAGAPPPVGFPGMPRPMGIPGMPMPPMALMQSGMPLQGMPGMPLPPAGGPGGPGGPPPLPPAGGPGGPGGPPPPPPPPAAGGPGGPPPPGDAAGGPGGPPPPGDAAGGPPGPAPPGDDGASPGGPAGF